MLPATSAMTVSQRLGAFLASCEATDIPADMRERARYCLLHDLIIGMAGRPWETTIQAMARDAWREPREATLLSDGSLIGVEGAAFANAALMNVRSQDDTHEASVSHPGVPVIAAALAVAETEGASGAELITACVLGYEMTGRIGRPCGPVMTRRGFRAAAVLGIFGATAAASRLLRLDARQCAHALGLATQMAAGHAQLWREGGTEFTIQLGQCARNGIVAARLARAGATAVPGSFEGQSGFYVSFAGEIPDVEQLLCDLGRRWEMGEVLIKPSPVCAALQGPVSLAQGLASEGLRLDDVETATLFLSPFEAAYPGVNNAGPIGSPAAAKMSAQFSLALALRDGVVSFGGLARHDDAELAKAAPRFTVEAEEKLQPRQCRLVIACRDGRAITQEVSIAVGRPEAGLVMDTARRLQTETGLTPQGLADLAEAAEKLDEAPDIGGLLSAWRRAIAIGGTTGA